MYSVFQVIKFAPNFEEDKTVYTAEVQELWRSIHNGLTFERLSGIPRARIGEEYSKCDMVTGWTGRDIVLLSFSPEFATADTMVVLSQTSYSDKRYRYMSVSTNRGATWTDMVGEKGVPSHRYWTSAVITAGPGAPEGRCNLWSEQTLHRSFGQYTNCFGSVLYSVLILVQKI